MFLVDFIEDRWHKEEDGSTVTETKTSINPEMVQKVTESERGKTAIMLTGGLTFTVYGSHEEVRRKLIEGSELNMEPCQN
jgi:hypothetical protein